MSFYTTFEVGRRVGLNAGRARIVGGGFALCFVLGLGGCGGSTPVPPQNMVGVGGQSGGFISGATMGGSWDARVQTSAPARRNRPKGGGHYKVGRPYSVKGKWYRPSEQPNYSEVGFASWYGDDFDGKKTANGEIYDMGALTAAHKTLPIPSYAYVTNLSNNRTVLVRINDRGPYKPGRIIDLSERISRELGFKHHGLAKVRVRYAGRAPLNGSDHRERAFLSKQNWHRHAAR